jgi:hypothetical protein
MSEEKKERVIKFVPEYCKQAGASIKGYVVLKAITLSDRYRLISAANFKLNDLGDVEASGDMLESLAIVNDKIKQYFVEVDFKHKDGTEFKSYDDLNHDERCHPLMQQIGKVMLKGLVPSGNSKA